jgi:hypothetical protein
MKIIDSIKTKKENNYGYLSKKDINEDYSSKQINSYNDN